MPLPYSDDLRWRIVWKHLFLKVDAEDVAKEMQDLSTDTLNVFYQLGM